MGYRLDLDNEGTKKKQRKPSTATVPKKEKGECYCGSTTHSRTSHSACPYKDKKRDQRMFDYCSRLENNNENLSDTDERCITVMGDVRPAQEQVLEVHSTGTFMS